MNVEQKDELLTEIGIRLQLIRKKLDIMQKDFADALDISGGSLSEIETGNAKPMFEVYHHLSKKFNVSMYYLLFGLGDMFVTGGDEGGNGSSLPDLYPREFLADFLKYFRNSVVFRYTMMSHFTQFLIENEQVIEKNIKNSKAGIGVNQV